MADFLTPSDLAARLGKSADYWSRQARAKRIPHVRLGRDIRFTEADVQAILTAAHVAPTDPLKTFTPPSRRRSA